MEISNDTQGINISFVFNSTTTVVTNHELQMDVIQGTTIVVLNYFLALIGTFGNFLIIFAVLDTPQLRQKPSNILLLSLAVADLVVTMVAQPIFTASTYLKTFALRCNRVLDMVYLTTGPFSACSSVYHLAAISIDRAISAVKPHQHRGIIKKWSKVMLCVCWGTATLFGCLLVKFQAVKYAIQVSLILSFVVMICSYGRILYKIKVPYIVPTVATMSSNARDRAMEKRVSGTIAIVILLFAVCWFPLVGYTLSERPNSTFLCSFNVKSSWIRTLLLANSSMNFIVYSLRIRQFRAAYLRIINRNLQRFGQASVGKCCCASPKQDNTTGAQVTNISSP